MSTSTPWFQSVGVHWAPELAFYERRIELLRYLEARDLLTAFRVEEGQVQGRLGSIAMRVTPQLAEVMLAGPTSDLAQAREVLAYVCGVINPAEVQGIFGEFQFVDELAVDYSTARRAAIDVLLPGMSDSPARFVDYSLLLDGHAPEVSVDCTFKVEMGIIDRGEAMERLVRSASRIGPPVEHRTDHILGILSEPDMPLVALFSDWSAASSLTSLDEAASWWDSMLEVISRVLADVERSVLSRDDSIGDTQARQQAGGGA